MSFSDPALCLLEASLGPIYEKLQTQQTSPPNTFQIDEMISRIERETNKLMTEREEKIRTLKKLSEQSNNVRRNFNTNLVGVNNKLTRAERDSKGLAEFCSHLAVDFTHITDRLDSATSIVTRAVMISNYLRDIRIYDSSDDFEVIKRELVKKNDFITFDFDTNRLNYTTSKQMMESGAETSNKLGNSEIHKTAEYVAKLLKIVDIAQRQNVAKVAFTNLKRHRSQIVVALLSKFNVDFNTTQNLKNIAKSLSSLGMAEEAMTNFITNTAIFNSEEGAKLQYGDDILKFDTLYIMDHYDRFCTFIVDECKNLWPKIDQIFERPQQVKLRYLKKVSGVLFAFVSGVLSSFTLLRPLDYCKSFSTMYKRSLRMVEEIFEIDHQEFTTAQSILDELFKTHQKSYGDIEIKIFSQIIEGKTTLKMLQLDKAMKPLGFFRKAEDIIDPIREFEIDDELFPELISIFKETMVRCSMLSASETVQKNLKKLIKIFLSDNFKPMITSYIRASTVYIQQNSDMVQNIPRFLKMITLLNCNVLSFEEVYLNSIKNILTPFSSIHSSFIREKEEMVEILERETVGCLKACVECAKNYGTKLLEQNQKKTDFMPLEHSAPIISEACLKFCNFFKKLLVDISMFVYGENKNSFLTNLGKALVECLLCNFSNFKFNVTGGLNLMMDVTEYQSMFQLMEVPRIDKIVNDLMKVSHLMAIAAELIYDDIQGTTISKRAVKFAKRLLLLRVDSKEIVLDSIFPNDQ